MSYKFRTFIDKLPDLLIDLADLLQKYLGAIAIATDRKSDSSWNLCGYDYNFAFEWIVLDFAMRCTKIYT